MLHLKRAIVFAVFALAAFTGLASQAEAQQRLALVIGQSAYEGRQLATAANDAGLIAQTLTSAGFEVVQGRDLNANDLRNVVRDFLDKAQDLGNDAAVVVYLSGYGVQLEGENYLLPVDARIQRDVDVPIDGFRLSDLVRSLERTPAQARIIVADMARDYLLPAGGDPLARGLALMEPPSGFLIAFSSAPNITNGDAPGPYGHYATALAEEMRQPGVPLDEVFNRVRLRTHETTKGLQTPWHMANLGNASFVFFEPEESAATPPPVREVRRIEEVPAEEAYNIAVERDTISDYQAFLRRYPDHPLSRRVTALLAARREAIVWRRTVTRNTREAYWTYLRRYPTGPHAVDSRRRLARLSAPVAPPEVFEEVVYEDLPPPLPEVERVEIIEVVTIIREAPPPPRPPVYLLPDYEEDEEFVTIIREPPPPPILGGILPIPAAIPVPRYARRPRSFYEPIAPITPRGPMAIPVAPPPVAGGLFGRPGEPRPPRGQRPVPIVPRQPGLRAEPRPIPVVARPNRPRPDIRSDAPRPQAERPRLPSRPIPVVRSRPDLDRPDLDAPRPVRERPRPNFDETGDRPVLTRPRPNVEDGPDRAARPRRPDLDASPRDMPAVRPRPARPDFDREQPRRPRPERPDPDAERAVRPRPIGPNLDDDGLRPVRRPVRPSQMERLEDERPRPRSRPALEPDFRPEPRPRAAPSRPEMQPRPEPMIRPRPEPRQAPPAMERPRPAAPAMRPSPEPQARPRPVGPRLDEGQARRPPCRPGQACRPDQGH